MRISIQNSYNRFIQWLSGKLFDDNKIESGLYYSSVGLYMGLMLMHLLGIHGGNLTDAKMEFISITLLFLLAAINLIDSVHLGILFKCYEIQPLKLLQLKSKAVYGQIQVYTIVSLIATLSTGGSMLMFALCMLPATLCLGIIYSGLKNPVVIEKIKK